MSDTAVVRPLSLVEVRMLVDWADKEGWNPSAHDAEAFQAADPQGFLGCFAGGELVAGISAVTYGEHFGFIGLYITRPDARGKGYGLKVWSAGMARLEGRTAGLDGVPEQQANYARMGFLTAYGTTRWNGKLTATEPFQSCPVRTDAVEAIADFDRRYFPAERRSFLESWLSPPRAAFAFRENDVIRGYAVIRQCADGCKLGPLFAETTDIAIDLLRACAANHPGKTIYLDMPDNQTEFGKFLTDSGFQSGFQTARMYRGVSPAIDMGGVFAVTTLELG